MKKLALIIPALIIHAVATSFILFCVGAFVLTQMLAMNYDKHVSLIVSIVFVCASYLYIRYNQKILTENK